VKLVHPPYTVLIISNSQGQQVEGEVEYCLTVTTPSDKFEGKATFPRDFMSRGYLFERETVFPSRPYGRLDSFFIQAFFERQDQEKGPGYFKVKDSAPPGKDLEVLMNLAFPDAFLTRPFAVAPIRTKPKRIYDIVRDTPQSTGDHVAGILLQIKLSGSEKEQEVIKKLIKFGEQCELFRDINVKVPTKKNEFGFSIMVQIAGHADNFVDVGYGISQVLPILVDAFRGRTGETYLLQQPEVHLHPSAQAQLGSLLGELAKRDKKTFIIETHSDYIVDRIRLEIQKKNKGFVRPEDVVILYFERNNGEVNIHPIYIDDMGNISGAPEGYRQFFLDEQYRFLGLK
jgi:hypothetical protein